MEHIFMKVIELSILAGSMIAAILIARLLLRKAPRYMHCLLWLFVAVRLICPLELVSPFGLLPSQSAQLSGTDALSTGGSSEADSVKQEDYDGGVSYNTADLQNTELSEEQKNAAAAGGGIQANRGSAAWYASLAALSSAYAQASSRFWSFVELHAQLLMLLWIAGIAVVLGYGVISYFSLYRKIRFAVPEIWKGTLESGADCAGRDSRKGTFLYKVYYADEIQTPFLLGVFRGRIYIPAGWKNQDLTYVIAHERAHLQRKDHILKPFSFLLLSVYWFQPLVWIAYILLCRDIEMACDERVIRSLGTDSKKDYATALFQGSVGRRGITACPVAFAEAGVRQRVKKILNYKKPAFWIMMVAVLICIAVPVCFMTQRNSKNDTNVGNAVNATGTDSSSESTFISDVSSGDMAVEDEGNAAGSVPGSDINIKQEQLEVETERLEGQLQEIEEQKAQLETQLENYRDQLTDAEVQELENQLEQYSVQLQQTQDQLEQLAEKMKMVQSSVPEISAVSALGKAFAQAFCNRDGLMLISFLSEEGIAQLTEQETMMISSDTGEVSFGWSSPWPWDDQLDYFISEINTEADTMKILYYAEVSDPHLSVWIQTLSYALSEGQYVITAQELQMTGIASATAYEESYPQGINDTRMDYLTNGLGEILNQNAVNDPGMYPQLFAPDTAARFLLGLDASAEISVRYRADQAAETADEASAMISFSDGTQITITMVRPYGADGIWIPQN